MTTIRSLLLVLATLCCFGGEAHAIYDAGTGRWLQRDPAGYIGSMNLYQYVLGNPVRLVDPMGLDFTDPTNDDVRFTPGSGLFTFPPYPKRRFGEELEDYNKRREYHRVPIDKCERDLNTSGATGWDLAIMETYDFFVNHQYLDTSGNPGEGDVEGYGLFDTNKKKGDSPNHERSVPGTAPKNCVPCYRSGGTLMHGKGAGKSSYEATTEDIKDCIKNTKLKQNYSATGYNCYDWVDDAAADCGLDCENRPAWEPG